MDNKIPEKTSEIKMNNHNKPDKIRRKLLVGAITTPLVLTLSSARAWAWEWTAHDIRGWAENPSAKSRDGYGFSCVFEGSQNIDGVVVGTNDTEFSLYVYLKYEEAIHNLPGTLDPKYQALLATTYVHNQAIIDATYALDEAYSSYGTTPQLYKDARAACSDLFHQLTANVSMNTPNELSSSTLVDEWKYFYIAFKKDLSLMPDTPPHDELPEL